MATLWAPLQYETVFTPDSREWGHHLKMVARVRQLTRDLKYDVISIGYPGVVVHGKIVTEPFNLGRGWVGFHFEAAFGRPVKLINDAAMQALGSYQGGRMLFLGLGTGLGSAMIIALIWLGMVVFTLDTWRRTRAALAPQAG